MSLLRTCLIERAAHQTEDRLCDVVLDAHPEVVAHGGGRGEGDLAARRGAGVYVVCRLLNEQASIIKTCTGS